jgi:hypothetical protein
MRAVEPPYPAVLNTVATGMTDGVPWPVGVNSPVPGLIASCTMALPFWLAA